MVITGDGIGCMLANVCGLADFLAHAIVMVERRYLVHIIEFRSVTQSVLFCGNDAISVAGLE